MFLPPLSYILSINFQTYSLDLCLYKLEKSCSSLECSAPCPGHTFYFTQCGLLRFKSSYKSRNRGGSGPYVLRRISSVLQSNYLRGGQYSQFKQRRVKVRWWWNGSFYNTRKIYSVQFRGSASLVSSEHLHMFLFQFLRIHSFLINFLTSNRTHSAKLDIHLAL